eukprot:gb/GFBE01014865.1/.p1 GENE.gb/GFBE01014865.1/~~gb/GFBE01014865.1/.p1  ORF type:complete len:765 (+),score=104.44 gb/GFBE01014865.1/:1-2295(+)
MLWPSLLGLCKFVLFLPEVVGGTAANEAETRKKQQLLSAFRTLFQLACFPGSTDYDVAFCCGHRKEDSKPECFNDLYDRDVCCAELPDEEEELDEELPKQTLRAEQEDECTAHWADQLDDLPPLQLPRCSPPGVNYTTDFHWNGQVVRREGTERRSFLASSVRLRCAEQKEGCSEVIHVKGAYTLVTQGQEYTPPPSAVAVMLKGERGHEEVIPLVRSLPPRRARSRRAGMRVKPGPSFYFLILDSVSRASMRRMLPLTYELITREAAFPQPRGTAAPDTTPPLPRSHEVFSFHKFHTTQLGGTFAQMFPIFFGGLANCAVDRDGLDLTPGWAYNITQPLKHCAAFPRSVLHALRAAGYRLGLASMGAERGFFRNWRWDYIVPHLSASFGLDSEEFIGDFACAGAGRHYYKLMMDWAIEVLRQNRLSSNFLYTHLQAAHISHRHLKFLDMKLRDHLLEVMQQNPELIVALASDHGQVMSMCDHRSPFLHLFVPSALLHSRPGLRQTLLSNSRQVVSGWDLFATLHHLARFNNSNPEDLTGFAALRARGIRTISASPIKAFQAAARVDLAGKFSPRSIFQELPRGRTCAEAGIAASHCAFRRQGVAEHVIFCHPWEELSAVTREEFAGLPNARLLAAWPQNRESYLACQVSDIAVVHHLVLDMQAVTEPSESGAPRVCEIQTLKDTELLRGDGSGTMMARFLINQGDPLRVFDARFQWSNYLTRMPMVLGVNQVTRYQKYEACTPHGLPAMYCVCDLSSTSSSPP